MITLQQNFNWPNGNTYEVIANADPLRKRVSGILFINRYINHEIQGKTLMGDSICEFSIDYNNDYKDTMGQIIKHLISIKKLP
jgi:hypothetical protein